MAARKKTTRKKTTRKKATTKKAAAKKTTTKKAEPVVEEEPEGPVAEEWVLCRSVHLGQVRDSFGAGTVIEHLVDEKKLRINGREYEGDNDLIALISLSQKTGQAWVANNGVWMEIKDEVKK